uniref:Uncharacterized protein n=1 Tax=uncultured Rhodospirillales bacterium HF0200_01O14 TaxID=710787 RepID=E0XTV2_9PROT|nr:hypothetical protein [uncultured Rhodospirillales bacterium HF0200_01O14]
MVIHCYRGVFLMVLTAHGFIVGHCLRHEGLFSPLESVENEKTVHGHISSWWQNVRCICAYLEQVILGRMTADGRTFC